MVTSIIIVNLLNVGLLLLRRRRRKMAMMPWHDGDGAFRASDAQKIKDPKIHALSVDG